jgi:hypothetical protein
VFIQARMRPAQTPGGLVSYDDFFAYMPMHNYIYTPSGDPWPASSVDSRLPPQQDSKGKPIRPSTWLDRNRPVAQMTWAPGEPQLIEGRLVLDGGWIERPGVACFNLYRPPTIPHGTAREAGAWLRHIERVYPEDARHIVLWLAHRVQRPHEKINHALLLGGAQGVGKDTLLEPVKTAVGPWNFSEVSPKQVMGRFSGFLRSVILRVSETPRVKDTVVSSTRLFWQDPRFPSATYLLQF